MLTGVQTFLVPVYTRSPLPMYRKGLLQLPFCENAQIYPAKADNYRPEIEELTLSMAGEKNTPVTV